MLLLSYLVTGARYAVAFAFAMSCLVALVHWGVRERKVNAFGSLARFSRKISDPLLKPLERRVIGFGGNPQDAPIWLIGLVLIGGLVFLAALQWIAGIVVQVVELSHGGPLGWVSFAVSMTYVVITTALLIRVIGSWFGIGRYNRWMRIAYRLTDWIVEPLRRALPAFGMIDVSPLVAWVILWLLRQAVARIFHV
ncbi:MAG: YggT family protein [Gemmatimonadota bacterium]